MRMANAISSDGNYWVWIPRIIYKDNKETVNVEFSNGISIISTKNKSTIGYETHPAFLEDGNISGFWVAKFQCNIEDEEFTTILPGKTLSVLNMLEARERCKNIKSESIKDYVSLMSDNEKDAILKLASSLDIDISNDMSFYSGGGDGLQDFYNNPIFSSSGTVYGVYDLISSENEVTRDNIQTSTGRFRPVLIIK